MIMLWILSKKPILYPAVMFAKSVLFHFWMLALQSRSCIPSYCSIEYAMALCLCVHLSQVGLLLKHHMKNAT